LVETPTVVTLHGRLDLPELAALYDEYREIPLIAISDAQRQALPSAKWMTTVHHGLPADLFRFSPAGGDYLLFLGRNCPEKKTDAAIRVARRAGVSLRIAAKVDPVDRPYFEEVVRPLLVDPLVDYIGEVGDDLLGGALALLFPIDGPEPFGLVMIESLACGTPVIARRRGSVPEVLRHGETAWLCETEDEMVRAVEEVRALDRRRCREEFDRRFTVTAMTARYLEAYECLTKSKQPALHAPTADLTAPMPIVAQGNGGRRAGRPTL
jgi:glycosyltransferase involved in cell wall biosynthesis